MERDWLMALIGGVLIGTASATLLVLNGRIFGVSGIVGEALSPRKGDAGWRFAAMFGLLTGGAALTALHVEAFDAVTTRSLPAIIAAGLLVGFGTRLGGGCTSGHGICGIGRLQPRSVLATATFIVAGAVTATLFGLKG